MNVLIADNQPLTRTGIIAVLTSFYTNSLNIKEVFTNHELQEALKTFQPSILIIDYDLFDFNDIADLRNIRKAHPLVGILVVSDNKSANAVLKIIDCGITNYIAKTCESTEFMDAFNATLQSKKYFGSEIMDVILEHKTSVKNNAEQGNLTASEIVIVKLITQGLTTKEIASNKNLSFHTIITHRKNIFRKLGINNSSELLMYAMRAGLIDTTEYYI